ncbi:hypothetical protein GMOD_00010036 [Pyrenophora seminiperda CCB06]|uniref:Uncharacterized protein n=1 Tax=Pyrenophora seminiperda CCB06 TaxID=1302712 RepID=A0A3M7M1Y2_9PLEO|nr:hypothetical protein GMOD_00010036 [Pyrenophora seminiperda CCB06]
MHFSKSFHCYRPNSPKTRIRSSKDAAVGYSISRTTRNKKKETMLPPLHLSPLRDPPKVSARFPDPPSSQTHNGN